MVEQVRQTSVWSFKSGWEEAGSADSHISQHQSELSYVKKMIPYFTGYFRDFSVKRD